MAHYLILESRDPYDSADWVTLQDFVTDLRKAGNEVTLFLLQNGVLPARKGTEFEHYFASLRSSGIRVLADFFALQERGIQEVAKSVERTNLEQLIQICLRVDTKTLWH